ncbi:MAG: hypothetical protein J6W27_04410 [Alphaproteobacteria bacterium]|nr:hypothetical protein [Alphaproteobacteria bacterium]
MRKYLLSVLFCLLVMSPYAYAALQATSFPKTYADTTFVQRIQNATEGYKPFMDKKAYRELDIIPGEEIYTDHMIADAEQQQHDAQTMNIADYCHKYPYDTEKCGQTNTSQTPSTTTTPSTPTTTTSNTPTTTTTFSGRTIGGGTVTPNNQVIGGSCYPAARDRHFTNQILTTGKYESISPAFEKSLITIFRKEGRCGTIPNDPCGYTCYGIGSSPNCAGVVVNSRAEAEDFYYNRFWQKYHIYKLPDVISTDILLASMASGPGTALSQFRVFLGLPSKTSAVDDEMVNAVKTYSGDIHNKWMDKRDAFLQDVAQRRYNGRTSQGYANAIELKRKNGCHVQPTEPLYR